MPMMLERWNDDKMDALAGRVDDLDKRMEKGFARVDADLRDLRGEVKVELRDTKAELREQRFEMKAGFERIDDRFDRLHRMLFQACIVLFVTLIGFIGVPQL